MAVPAIGVEDELRTASGLLGIVVVVVVVGLAVLLTVVLLTVVLLTVVVVVVLIGVAVVAVVMRVLGGVPVLAVVVLVFGGVSVVAVVVLVLGRVSVLPVVVSVVVIADFAVVGVRMRSGGPTAGLRGGRLARGGRARALAAHEPDRQEEEAQKKGSHDPDIP